MRIEHAPIRRGLRDSGIPEELAQVLQIGIGRAAVERALRSSLRDHAGIRGVIVAGVCGGLRHTEPVPRIASVVDRNGRSWSVGSDGWALNRPASAADGHDRGVRLVGVDELIPGPAEKRALAAETGADIVDMESHALAALCDSRGWPWAVVRGVSDTPDETLPEEVLAWTTAAGDPRPGRAILDMARKPSLIGHTRSAMRRCRQVLPIVAERVAALIRSREGA